MTHTTRPTVPKTLDEAATFRVPRSLNPSELADTVGRLVWESFSDFLAAALADDGPIPLGISDESGIPEEHGSKEALIFILWAHTRAIQMAFHDRATAKTVGRALDALHAAVFEDLVEHGMPRAALPLFEQRVSARYAEYYQASAVSDGELGAAVVRHLRDEDDAPEVLVHRVVERARAVANPLRDFLEEVELKDV